jgi:folate-binding protein YgfZ
MSDHLEPGYRALRESAGWLDLSERGRIRVTGEDRVRLLHAITTNHIQQLETGQGCYAFFLNPQGRILGDAVILAFPDALLLGTEPETRRTLFEHLNKYIIADDVTLEDISANTFEAGVEGPHAERVLRAAGAEPPGALWSWNRWGERTVVRTRRGFSVIAPAGGRAELIDVLEAGGAVRASAAAARVVRLELGQPRYSEDLSDRYLPHETQQLEAVHFNKGCYLGQEIVERVRSRGGVHRFLLPLEVDSAEPPLPGSKILAAGGEVGEITSAAWSPALGRTVALGYLRKNELPTGAELTAEGQAVRIRSI